MIDVALLMKINWIKNKTMEWIKGILSCLECAKVLYDVEICFEIFWKQRKMSERAVCLTIPCVSNNSVIVLLYTDNGELFSDTLRSCK
jgi:hypothetical protein